MAADPAQIARLLRGDATLACLWRRAMGQPPADDPPAVLLPLAKALGAYVGTLQSGRTPFDGFRDALARGDRAAAARYPLAAQRGLRIFIGRGNCSTCHAGPLFTNGEFGDIGQSEVQSETCEGVNVVRSVASQGPGRTIGKVASPTIGTCQLKRPHGALGGELELTQQPMAGSF